MVGRGKEWHDWRELEEEPERKVRPYKRNNSVGRMPVEGAIPLQLP